MPSDIVGSIRHAPRPAFKEVTKAVNIITTRFGLIQA